MWNNVRKQMVVGLAMMVALLMLAACSSTEKQEAGDNAANLIQKGWMAYRLNEFQNAEMLFSQARDSSAPGSDPWAMATYGLGLTWNLRRPGEDPQKAAALYDELMTQAPKSPMAPWTELAIARMIHLVPVGQEPDYDAVNAAYQHIVDTYPGHLAAKEALLYLESIQLAKLEPKSSAASAKRLLDFIAHEKKEFVGPAWSLLSVAYTTMDDQPARLHAEQEAFAHTETDPTDPSVEFAWAYWNLAVIAEFEVGDFDLARQYYNLLLEKYPNDQRVHGCKTALKRMDAMEAALRAEIAEEEK